VGIRDSFPREKQPECEADHLPPSSADVKNAWSYTSTSACLHIVALNTAQEQLYLFLFAVIVAVVVAGKCKFVPVTKHQAMKALIDTERILALGTIKYG
jgi:hypothetical protein